MAHWSPQRTRAEVVRGPSYRWLGYHLPEEDRHVAVVLQDSPDEERRPRVHTPVRAVELASTQHLTGFLEDKAKEWGRGRGGGEEEVEFE